MFGPRQNSVIDSDWVLPSHRQQPLPRNNQLKKLFMNLAANALNGVMVCNTKLDMLHKSLDFNSIRGQRKKGEPLDRVHADVYSVLIHQNQDQHDL